MRPYPTLLYTNGKVAPKFGVGAPKFRVGAPNFRLGCARVRNRICYYKNFQKVFC